MTKFLVVLILFGGYIVGRCQQVFPPPADTARLEMRASEIHTPISIDGKLDEPAWTGAEQVSGFLEIWPSQLQSSKFSTSVKVLYNNKSLFIGAVCSHPKGRKGLRVQDMRRDFNYAFSEWFAVALDPFKDMRNPIPVLFVTPYSTQLDQLSYEDRVLDTNWDGVWRSKATVLDSGWVAEIEIPFASLRYPKDSSQWRINFIRLIRNESQMSAWSPIPRAFGFGRTSYAGYVNEIKAPKSNLNLRLQPYALLSGTRTNHSSADPAPKAGGEIKWGINPNTVLEGTVNTDFAQADVDRQVININRSSVFFPEKRQFFLENANLFSTGLDGIVQPFFSRTVGRDPIGSSLRINAGARLIHQNAKKAIGLMFIDQEGDSLQGPSRIGIARSQFNFSNNSRVGVMGIVRNDAAFGANASNLNYVGVVDGFARASQSLYIRPMLSFSNNSDSGDRGYAGLIEVSYTKNTLVASLSETLVTNDYNSRTGFVARRDFMNSSASLLVNLNIQKYSKVLLFFRPSVTADIFHTASTRQLTEATISVTPVAFAFKGYHRVAFSILPSMQKLFSAFQPVASVSIASNDYRYVRYQASYDGNLSAPYSLSFSASTGRYYNGSLNSYFVSLRLAPIPHISCVLNYTRNDFRRVGEANLNVTKEIFAPELRLALNANVQLSGFYQYNTSANTGALNARFSWQYSPLSFIYIVYNDLRNLPSADTAFLQQAGIFKISYIRQI